MSERECRAEDERCQRSGEIQRKILGKTSHSGCRIVVMTGRVTVND